MTIATATGPSTSANSSAVAQAASAWTQAALAAGNLSYDPNKFYTRATDIKGHGEKIRGNVPPDVYAQMQSMVHSGDFPDYQMPMDIVRDGIVHIMASRQGQIGDVRMREQLESILQRLAFDEYSLKMAEEVNRWEQIHERLREALTALQRAGAWGQVWEYLIRGEELADPIPEPYRGATFDLINEWKAKVPLEFREG
jgi:hypothetical protein